MENRRTIIKTAIASVACAIMPPSAAGSAGVNEWILVADGKVNAHGRIYSEESLRTMDKSARGAKITTNPPEGTDELGKLLGAVTESQFQNGAVFVKVRWFGDYIHSGFIAPWGNGKVIEGEVQNYVFEQMVAGNYSSFPNATRI